MWKAIPKIEAVQNLRQVSVLTAASRHADEAWRDSVMAEWQGRMQNRLSPKQFVERLVGAFGQVFKGGVKYERAAERDSRE